MYKIGIAAVALLIAGCTVSGPDPILAFGIPNPASVYCIERGGTLDIEQRAEGQVNMCVLSDGTRIEEWDLYRRDHPQRQMELRVKRCPLTDFHFGSLGDVLTQLGAKERPFMSEGFFNAKPLPAG